MTKPSAKENRASGDQPRRGSKLKTSNLESNQVTKPIIRVNPLETTDDEAQTETFMSMGRSANVIPFAVIAKPEDVTRDMFLASLTRFTDPTRGIVALAHNAGAGWPARQWIPGVPHPNASPYFTVSTVQSPGIPGVDFEAGEKVKIGRHSLDCVQTFVIVLDDVSSKVAAEGIPLAPTYRLESSPGNFQYGYQLATPAEGLDALPLINAIRKEKNADCSQKYSDLKGSAGVNRVMRYPGSVNVKPGKNNFRSVCREWAPDRLFTIEQIATAFGLTLEDASVPAHILGADTDLWLERLRRLGLVLSSHPNSNGFYDIICCWYDHHGHDPRKEAAYKPGKDRGVYYCHHTGCDGRDLDDLTEYLLANDPVFVEELRAHLAAEKAERSKSVKDAFAAASGAEVDDDYTPPSKTEAEAVERRNAAEAAVSGRTPISLDPDSLANSADAVRAVLRHPDRNVYMRSDVIGTIANSNGSRTFRRHTAPMLAEEVSRHARITSNDKPLAALPESICRAILDAPHALGARPLTGFSRAPIIREDGSTLDVEGFDETTGVYVYGVPAMNLPAAPTEADARAALLKLRDWLSSFPYADRAHSGKHLGLRRDMIDTAMPPGFDETAGLALLLTAVARPSIDFAPMFAITAPSTSGTRTGKAKLLHAAAVIAHGGDGAEGFTWDSKSREENTKQLVSKMLAAPPVLLMDEANNCDVHLPLLHNLLTEKGSSARILGKSESVNLHARTLLAAAGNGLTIRADLATRCVPLHMDARTEYAGDRKFDFDPVERAQKMRAEVLAWALTILRWGRQNADVMSSGRAMGGFEAWASWIRDPLLALGCPDLVERVIEAQKQDSSRNAEAEFMTTWYLAHGTDAVETRDVHASVAANLGNDGKPATKQQVAQRLRRRAGTRAGGWSFERAAGLDSNRNGTVKYCVTREDGQYPARAVFTKTDDVETSTLDREGFAPVVEPVKIEKPANVCDIDSLDEEAWAREYFQEAAD
jgi:hypothetical protein